MATGNSTQLTRQIGEHLVAAKLGRLGLFAAPFAGNVPDFDLIAMNLEGKTAPIQVKTINGPSWQFLASSFLEIEMVGNEQFVRGLKTQRRPGLVCVFIILNENEEDDFYILSIAQLQAEIAKTYKGGVRPKNPLSMHCAVWPKQLHEHKDNWQLILDSLT